MKNQILITTNYNIVSEKLPAEFDGFRLALLADLHNCQVGEGNGALLRALRREQPDRILIGGDLITEEKHGRRRVFRRQAGSLLKELVDLAPVSYGIGNHEKRWQAEDLPGRKRFRDWQKSVEGLGVEFLDNRSVELHRRGASIRLTGLSLPLSCYRKGWHKVLPAGCLEGLVGKAPREEFTILLAHTPDYGSEYHRWGADLSLAGHNHGGWFRLPLLGGAVDNNCRPFPKYDRGLFSFPEGKMIVSAGLGEHTLPIRFNNPPELVMITLCSRGREGEQES